MKECWVKEWAIVDRLLVKDVSDLCKIMNVEKVNKILTTDRFSSIKVIQNVYLEEWAIALFEYGNDIPIWRIYYK